MCVCAVWPPPAGVGAGGVSSAAAPAGSHSSTAALWLSSAAPGSQTVSAHVGSAVLLCSVAG